MDEAGGLSGIDQLACLKGYGNLLEKQSKTTLAWLDWKGVNTVSVHIPSKGCKQKDMCIAAVKDVALDLFSSYRPYVMAIAEWDESWESDLCRACRKDAKKVFDAGRKECWAGLPEAFGLPGWEELKVFDFE